MAVLGSSLLGASTFCAKQHGADECDAKGLPLTLSTTNIIGRFQYLKGLRHPHLAVYLDAKKLKNERLVIVLEWSDDCVENHVKSSSKFASLPSLSHLARQVLSALCFLEEKGVTHRALAPNNVLISPEGDIKLHNYGLYYMTDCGSRVNFPVGSPRYLAPEVIIAGPDCKESSSPKGDVWSLGIVLLELFMETTIYPDLFLRNTAIGTLLKRVVLMLQNYQRKSISPLTSVLEAHACSKAMDADMKSFLTACLTPLPSKRPSAKTLLGHPFITSHSPRLPRPPAPFPRLDSPFSSLVRCGTLGIQSYHSQQVPEEGVASSGETCPLDNLSERPLSEVYYLWSLAGGDLEVEMRREGLILSRPPIFIMPSLMTSSGGVYGTNESRVALYDDTVLPLSLDQLRKRLEGMTTEHFYPLMESIEENQKTLDPTLLESAKLPLAIKENDVEYQVHRTILFSRLLESYPHSRELIVSEATVDICPLLRGEIWAAILGVKGDLAWQYSNIDKDSTTATDRQIDVDIPRCHQYDTLLSSRVGHKKFKRLLKSWVVSHPKLVYWQGLDSLCAPFLALNFNNEALAYFCLSAFIDRFLHKFFLKDNSPIMQEYLAVFSQLISFHDPGLYDHLDTIMFFPELYAIPWFLTMFTHILPLTKIYHLWDTMLLGNCSFPLFVGLAILQQLREDLLCFDFNACILMFSDMPVIDIQTCIQTAIKLFQTTPASAYFRHHQEYPTQSEQIPAEADRQPLPLHTLKQESSPQISAHDLITMCRLEAHNYLPRDGGVAELNNSHLLNKSISNSKKKARPKALVVDIRPNEEFRSGHVPGSINIPNDAAIQSDGSLAQTAAAHKLKSVPRGRVVCVVGNKGETAPIFARQLVRLNFSKVCVLYGGAGVLRTLGVLSSLQDDL